MPPTHRQIYEAELNKAYDEGLTDADAERASGERADDIYSDLVDQARAAAKDGKR